MASSTDVAKLAGVSIATVSRVINRHPQVDPKLVEVVQQAIARLGYQPPETSRVGRPRKVPSGIRAGTMALLFPDSDRTAIKTPLSAALIHGIEEALRERNLTLIVSGLNDDGDLPPSIDSKMVDGVIVRGGTDQARLSTLLRGIPAVWMFESGGVAPHDWDFVLDDNAMIGSMAAQYLLDCNCGSLALVNMMPRHPSFKARIRAFADLLEQAGRPAIILSENAEAAQLIDRITATRPAEPLGVFVPGSDSNVSAVYRALTARGLALGRHFYLISCNNDPHRLETLNPALPNIDIQAEHIARAAVEMLLWRLRNAKDPARRVIIAPKLIANSNASPGGALPAASGA